MKTNRIIASIVALCFFGCANLTPTQQTAFNNLETNVAQAAGNYLTSGNASFAQDIPLALNSIADIVPLVAKTSSTSGAVQSLVSATIANFTADPSALKSGNVGAKIGAAITNAIASGIPAKDAVVAAATSASGAVNPQMP